MNNRVLRLNYARITILKNKFRSEEVSLHALLDTKLSKTLSTTELNSLEAKIRKTDKQLQQLRKDIISINNEILTAQRQHTKRNASITFSSNQLISHSDKSKTVTSDKILERVRQDSQIQEIIENYPNNIRKLFDKVNYRRHQLQTSCVAEKNKFMNSLGFGIDMNAYHEFLINPKLKVKVNHNPFYAFQIRRLNKEVIVRNAQTIAAVNRKLFLNIPRDQILSPWKYNTSGVDLDLKAFSANFNAIAHIVKSAILDEENIEKRTLAIEEWIWTANHLLNELHDYSGFHAICSALNSSSISRLKKSFNGISEEAKAVLERLQAVAIGELIRGEQNKAALNSQHAIIPFLATFLKDFTFIKDGNATANISAGSDLKRERIEECTAGGKKRILEFDILQRELRKQVVPLKINFFLQKQLQQVRETSNFGNDDEEYAKSQQLEPLQNSLESAAILELFKPKTLKPLKQKKSTLKQMVLQELINYVKTFLSNLKNEIQTIQLHEIDWPRESEKLLTQQMKKIAYIDALQDYVKTLDDSSLVNEAKLLVNQLQDFFQIKTNAIEAQAIEALKQAKLALSASAKITQTSHDMLSSPASLNSRYLMQLNNQLSIIAVQLKGFQTTVQHISKIHEKALFPDAAAQNLSLVGCELEISILSIETLLTTMQARSQAMAKPSSWERAAPISEEKLSACRLVWLNANNKKCNQTEHEVSIANTFTLKA